MQACLKLLSLFAVATIAAYLASRALVPDTGPPGDSEPSQRYLQLAFLLRTIELTGLGGMVLALVAGVATRLRRTSG
jgi:hypothetical protein